MQPRKVGEIITFYSFKGGVGRTMALANLSVLTSKLSNLTLMIDWDLEAPGLHKFFYKYISPEEYDSKLGLIDLFIRISQLIESDNATIRRKDLKKIFDKIDISSYIIKTTLENLYLMKSGKIDELYSEKINKFNWVEFFYKTPDFFLLFSEYLKEKFDYTFIDSRTGFTDTGGICTTLLPDKLCLLFTTNKQSLDGISNLTKKALTYRRDSTDFRPLKIYPIPSRVELAEKDLRDKWRKGEDKDDIQGFQPLFENIFNTSYGIKNCDLTNYFDAVQIHHEPKYSYGEQIAVLTDNFSDNLSLTNVYKNLFQKIIIDSTIYNIKKNDSNFLNNTINVYFSFSMEDHAYSRLLMEKLSNKINISILNYSQSVNNIHEELISQINNSEVFIPIITPSFAESEVNKFELSIFINNYLINESFVILPIVIGIEPRDVPSPFNKMKCIYYDKFENNVERITEDIKLKILSSRSLKSRLTDTDAHPKNLQLNSREIEFIRLAVTELTYTEIADKMSVSPRTVDSYRENIFQKLNVKTRVGLVIAALKDGLVEL